MVIEVRDTGVLSDRGWQRYETDAETPAEAAYRNVRERHPWLTDDNHTWTADDDQIRIFRTEAADPPAAITPTWARDDYEAGAQWFCSTRFRLPDTPQPDSKGEP